MKRPPGSAVAQTPGPASPGKRIDAVEDVGGEHVTDAAGVHPATCGQHAGLEEEVVVDAEGTGTLPQGRGDALVSARDRASGFSTSTAAPRRQRADREVGVRVGRRADVHHVGAFGRQALVQRTSTSVRRPNAAAVRRALVRVEIAEDERRAVVEAAHGGSVRLGDAAAAHHGDLHAGVSARRGA